MCMCLFYVLMCQAFSSCGTRTTRSISVSNLQTCSNELDVFFLLLSCTTQSESGVCRDVCIQSFGTFNAVKYALNTMRRIIQIRRMTHPWACERIQHSMLCAYKALQCVAYISPQMLSLDWCPLFHASVTHRSLMCCTLCCHNTHKTDY